MPIRGVLLFTFLLGSLPVCFVRPFYGIVLWTILAILNPQTSLFYWDAALAFPWALAVAAPTLAGVLVFHRNFGALKSWGVYLMIMMWIWFTITSVVSNQTAVFVHHSADTWEKWGTVTKIMLMTFVTIMVTDSFSRLRSLLLTISGCFGYFVFKSVPFMISTGGIFRLYGPDRSMIGDNNDLGLALCMTLPIHYSMIRCEEKPWIKWYLRIAFFVTIPAIFITYSRGALLGLVAVMLLMLIQAKQRMVLVPVLLCAAFIVVVFAPMSWKNRMNPDGAIDASARSRFNAWTYSWRLASDYPVFGGGFDTFTQELFDRYAPNPLDVHGPHSVYFGVLAEHGFPGLMLYLTLVGWSFLSTFRLVRRAENYDDDVAIRYAQMLRFSLVGFLVSGAFLGRAYFEYYFTIVGCLIILNNICAESWSAEEEQQEQVFVEASA